MLLTCPTLLFCTISFCADLAMPMSSPRADVHTAVDRKGWQPTSALTSADLGGPVWVGHLLRVLGRCAGAGVDDHR